MEKETKQKWKETLNLEEYIKNITLEYPVLNKKYQMTNFVQYNHKNELTSDSKEQYLLDSGKINKKKNNKKKKNKNRWFNVDYKLNYNNIFNNLL